MRAEYFSLPALRLLLVATLFFSFFFNLHGVPLFDLDEGAFCEATREMFERGDFISTYLNNIPRFDKPILTYWLQAVTTSLFGFTEYGCRLPSSFASLVWVGFVVAFLHRLMDERVALTAGIVLAGMLTVALIGKSSTADALLNAWLTGSLLAFFLYFKERRRRYVWAMFALMGLGFLTKGPVAVLVLGAVSFIFMLAKRDLRTWLRVMSDPVGIALFFLIAGPWYVAEYLARGQAFIDGFFMTHNVGRFQGPMEGHTGSLFYYVPVVLIAVLPFTAVLLKLLGRVGELAKDDLKSYAAIWFVFVFVFFSLSGTKLPHYMNYGLTGLAILVALYLKDMRSAWWSLLPALMFLLFLTAAPGIFFFAASQVQEPFYADTMRQFLPYFGTAYVWSMLVAVVIVAYAMIERSLPVDAKLLMAAPLMVVVMSAVFMPQLGSMAQLPVKEAAIYAKEHDLKVVMWGLNMPTFSVYSQRVVERRQPVAGDVVFTTAAELRDWPNYEVLYQRGGVLLARLY